MIFMVKERDMTKTETQKLKAEAYDLILEQAKAQQEFQAKNQTITQRLNEINEELKE